MPILSVLGRCRQEDQMFKVILGLYGETEASLKYMTLKVNQSYTLRLHLKIQKLGV